MIERLLAMLSILRNADEYRALQWFKSHNCSVGFAAGKELYAVLNTPDRRIQMVGFKENLTLAQLQKKCAAIWEVAEFGRRFRTNATSN